MNARADNFRGSTPATRATLAAMSARSSAERLAARRLQLDEIELALDTLDPVQAAARIAQLAETARHLADHQTNDLQERMSLLSAAGRCAFEATVLEAALRERGLA